jgi:hypothetical protein
VASHPVSLWTRDRMPQRPASWLHSQPPRLSRIVSPWFRTLARRSKPIRHYWTLASALARCA